MSDTNDTTQKPSGGKTLSLKKTETSTVKQSFSHGRTKAVVVEKKRTLGGAPVAPTKAPAETKVASTNQVRPTTAPSQTAAPAPRGVVLRQLTEEEKARRGAALADARVYEEEARRQAEADARRRAEEESLLQKEREAALRRKVEEDKRKAAEEIARKHAEEEAARRDGGAAPARPGPAAAEAP